MKLAQLPVNPPILPMLARRVEELPSGEDWIFGPKWDGFRALIFRANEEIFIQSRDEKPLNRYFPELLDPLRFALPARCVLNGEICNCEKQRPRLRTITAATSSCGFTRAPSFRAKPRIHSVL